MKSTKRHNFHLFLLGCLSFSTQTRAGIVLPPQRVSAEWVSDFTPGLSWIPPSQPETHCSYRVTAKTKSLATNEQQTSPASFFLLTMEGGSIHWNITRVCDGSPSKTVVLHVSYPELVKDLSCFLYSPHNVRCLWSPNTLPADFGFYYMLVDECPDHSVGLPLRKCLSYIFTGGGPSGGPSGCDLQATRCHDVYVLVNGTVNGERVRNTFKRSVEDDVRLPPLEWDIKEVGNKFNISWTRPVVPVPDGWKIQINYTVCGVTHEPLEIEGDWLPDLLTLNPSCHRAVAVRATSQSGATPWGEWKHFDGEANPLLYVVVVPVLSAALVALVCLCFRRNKDRIFSKVPEPFDYISDIYNNNNNTQSVFHDFYMSPKEEECKISVVVDPQLGGTAS